MQTESAKVFKSSKKKQYSCTVMITDLGAILCMQAGWVSKKYQI